MKEQCRSCGEWFEERTYGTEREVGEMKRYYYAGETEYTREAGRKMLLMTAGNKKNLNKHVEWIRFDTRDEALAYIEREGYTEQVVGDPAFYPSGTFGPRR